MEPGTIDITGIGPAAAKTLAEHGFSSIKSVASTTVEKLAEVPGFSEVRAGNVIAAATELLPAKADSGKKQDKKDKKGKKGKDKKKDKKGKKGKKGKKK